MITRHPTAFAIIAFLAAAILGILLRPLTPVDETRYLSVAWEMFQTGDWLVPTKNFAPYSDKPPMLFWAINLVWLLTGVSEFAARLVVPGFAAVAIWLCAMLARRLWPEDPGSAGRAALALAGLSTFGISGGLTMFDVPLGVATLAGMICLVDAVRDPGAWRPWAGFGAAIALGVLVKGPVILFHLLPAAVLLPLWSRGPLGWRLLPARLGFGLALACWLVALWLVPALLTAEPAWREAVLWHQSAGRLTESFAHAQPWWYFLAMLPLLGFPLLWIPSLGRAARRTPWDSDRGLRLCLIWFCAALFLFSLTSGKQLHYLVPELPALALIAARLSRGLPGIGLAPAAIALALLGIGGILVATGLLPAGRLGTQLSPHGVLIAWALILLSLAWLSLRITGLAGAMLLSLGLLSATNLLIHFTRFGKDYDTAEIAAALAPHDRDGIAWFGATWHAEFGFAARLTCAVALPEGPPAMAAWMASHPGGVILGLRGPAEPAWPPEEEFRFRTRDYGLWSVAAAR